MILSLLQTSVTNIATLEYHLKDLQERQDMILTAKTAGRAGKYAQQYIDKKETVLRLLAAVLDFKQDLSDIDEAIHNEYYQLSYCVSQDMLKVDSNLERLKQIRFDLGI